MTRVESKWCELVESGLAASIIEEHGATDKINKIVSTLYQAITPRKRESLVIALGRGKTEQLGNEENIQEEIKELVDNIVDDVLAKFKSMLEEAEIAETTGVDPLWYLNKFTL